MLDFSRDGLYVIYMIHRFVPSQRSDSVKTELSDQIIPEFDLVLNIRYMNTTITFKKHSNMSRPARKPTL